MHRRIKSVCVEDTLHILCNMESSNGLENLFSFCSHSGDNDRGLTADQPAPAAQHKALGLTHFCCAETFLLNKLYV